MVRALTQPVGRLARSGRAPSGPPPCCQGCRRGPRRREPVEPQDALEVGEQHLDLLPLAVEWSHGLSCRSPLERRLYRNSDPVLRDTKDVWRANGGASHFGSPVSWRQLRRRALLRGTPSDGAICGHRSAVKLAAAIAVFGADASTDAIRRKARSSVCGGRRQSAINLPSFVSVGAGRRIRPAGPGRGRCDQLHC